MLYHQDVRMCAGDERTLSISISNPSGVTVVGAVARYALATAPMGRPLINKSSPTGINISTGVAPVAIILDVGLKNDDTALLPPGDYYHEALLLLASGAVISVMNGKLRLDPANIGSTL